MSNNCSKKVIQLYLLGIFLSPSETFGCYAKKPVENLEYLDSDISQITEECFAYSRMNDKKTMSSLTENIQGYDNLPENSKLLIERFIILKCLKSKSECLFKEEAERCMLTNYKIDSDLLEKYVLINEENAKIDQLPDFEIKSCFQFNQLQSFVFSNIKSSNEFHKRLQSKIKFNLISKEIGSLDYCSKVQRGEHLSSIVGPVSEIEPLLITEIRESWDLTLLEGEKEEKVLRNNIAYVINTDGDKYPLVSKTKSGNYQIFYKGKKFFIKQKVNGASSLLRHLNGMHLYISTGATGNCFNPNDNSKCDITELGGNFIGEHFKFVDGKLHVLSIPFYRYEETTNCEVKKFDFEDSVWIQYFKNSEFQQNLHRVGC